MEKPEFYSRFVADLRSIGVLPGKLLLVHSGIRPFGYVPGGAETIIQGLLEVLGEKGTLLLPALSYETVTPEKPCFDILNTPSCVGLIAENFRLRSGTRRSMHPTHSVCGVGPLAEALLAAHALDTTPCGPNSPFHRLPELDGQILMLACNLTASTSMHAIEEMAPPPYLFTPPILYKLTDEKGKTSEKQYTPHNFQGWNQRYDRLANVLAEPSLRVGMVAGAQSYLIDSRVLWQTAVPILRQNPLYFVDRVRSEP